jgi:hypothetical protein
MESARFRAEASKAARRFEPLAGSVSPPAAFLTGIGARHRAARAREDDMIVRNAMAAMAAGFALVAAAPADAGPCTERIDQTNVTVEKLLDDAAANAKPAAESTFATMHRQPTPGTVASAEERAGNLSQAQVEAITEKLDAARDADIKGDRPACEKALNEAERLLTR